MAVTYEKQGRDITAVLSGGLVTVTPTNCKAKTLPGLEPGAELDATTDDVLQVVKEMYGGTQRIANAVLTMRQEMTVFELAKDLAITHTEGILTFTSAFSSKTLTIAVVEIAGIIFNGVDNEGEPAMEMTILCRGGVTANEPIGA